MDSMYLVGRLLRLPLFAAVMLSATAGALAAEPRALWQLAPAPVLKAAQRGIHPLDISTEALSRFARGDVVHVELPGGSVYAATTTGLELHPNGDRSWVGKFDWADKTYTSVITHGAGGVIGAISTPEGQFQVRMDGSYPVLIDIASAGGQVTGWGHDWTFDSLPIATKSPETAVGRATGALKAETAAPQTIDVLIGYTDGFVTGNNNSQAQALTRINNLIAITNQAYVDSQVLIALRLVHAIQVNYPDNTQMTAALQDLRNGNGAVVSSLRGELRDRYGADLTVLLRQYNLNMGGCGLADVAGFADNGANIGQFADTYAVVFDGRVNDGNGFAFCQDGTLAHEIGHNMGALHDVAANGGTAQVGAFTYSYGYVTPDAVFQNGSSQCPANSLTCFGTIMAYVNQSLPETLRFSNPNVATCGGGAAACGTATANVALSFNNTRVGVSTWRPTKLPFTGTKTGDNQTAAPGLAFGQPLKVILRDLSTGNPLVPGVIVTFAAPTTGASANLGATTVVTDANGEAQVTATANLTPGSYTVTATANPGFVTTAVTFNLTNGAGTTTLTVSLKGTGTGSVTGSLPSGINCPGVLCTSGPMPAGTSVTLTAAADAGSVFTGWLGTPGCLGNVPCAVTVNTSKTVDATFAPASQMVPAGAFPSKVDPDLNGQYLALNDGLIVLRYLFQLAGATLTQDALGPAPTRNDPTQIATFLGNIRPQLDIDGDGRADALTDGILFLRYLFQLRGVALMNANPVGPGAVRTTAAAIEAYIATLIVP